MSFDMYVSASKNQATSVGTMAKKQVEGYNQLQKAINDFVMNSPFLSGKTYDSAKAYFSQVLYPIAQGGILLTEAVEEAVKKFPNEYQGNVDSGDLKQSELEEKIRQGNRLIAQAEEIGERLLSEMTPDLVQSSQLTSNAELIRIYQESKRELETKLSKLLAFNARSSAIFSEISALESAINQGLAQCKTAFNSNSGTFTLPKNLEWASAIASKWENAMYLQMSEDQKLEFQLRKQFGLSEDEAKSLIKIKNGLDKRFPRATQKERDYLFNRLIGAMSYGNYTELEFGSIISRLKWGQTAGHLSKYFNSTETTEEIFASLGLSKEEYLLLKYSLQIQHNLSGTDDFRYKGENYYDWKTEYEKTFGVSISNKDFLLLWNEYVSQMSNKSDFTHQSITTSTILDETYKAAQIIFGMEKTKDLSGWLGDATIQPVSFGNDDYMADLDAENITYLMQKNQISFAEAANDYYYNLGIKYTRSELFLKNNRIEDVKNAIFEELGIENNNMIELKEKFPESYQFILNLENKTNQLEKF